MAGFKGICWANKQMRFLLKSKDFDILASGAKVVAVSRSIHYGLFLAFEGIRFFCKRNERGKIEIIFLNLGENLKRFQRGIAFNLSREQQKLVPSPDLLTEILLRYFRHPDMNEFLVEMSSLGVQGYLRPFTFDEEQSIGVTFPENPSIRCIACHYESYLGEPFSGVVVPNLVRAVDVNGTGCLKLGINYVMSVKAVDEAKRILPEAGAALFLDDCPNESLETRKITEWDSSCCLFAMRDGTVVKIPESNLILPSVTIKGICAILEYRDVRVEERDILYGELIERSRENEIVAICSVGTAGILNRAQKLLLVDKDHNVLAWQHADESHELFRKLDEAKRHYWDIYQERAPVPESLHLNRYEL